MLKKTETLFDTMYQYVYKYPNDFTPLLRQKMREARRFVLDDDMSAFLADIGWAAYREKMYPEYTNLNDPSEIMKVIERAQRDMVAQMDHVRQQARLPHKTTWIEWNEKPFARRARAEYGSNMDENLVPIKAGWLLMQHDTIETAFETICVATGMTNFKAEGRMSIGILPFTIMWRTEDMPLPWHSHAWTLDKEGRPLQFGAQDAHGEMLERGASVSEILTGLRYESPYLAIGSAAAYQTNEFYLRKMSRDSFVNMLSEQGGMMRYVLGLLATINDLPISVKHVTTSKGFVAKGTYRKFLDHSVITLMVPTPRYRALARKAVMAMRRRAHQVRGHWREDHRNPGKKIWVREHQRGDATLGFVIHDYSVEKGEEA